MGRRCPECGSDDLQRYSTGTGIRDERMTPARQVEVCADCGEVL